MPVRGDRVIRNLQPKAYGLRRDDGRQTRGLAGSQRGSRKAHCGASTQTQVGEQEVHLIGSSFLLLDAPAVDGHCAIVGRGGGIVISVGSVVGVLLGLILGCRVIGDGGEDGRREYTLKRREHPDTNRSHRGELLRGFWLER